MAVLRSAFALSLLVCASVVHVSATAQDAVPDPAYETLVRDAIAAYEARELERSITLFQQAHALQPGPRPLRGIAMGQIELGEWVGAHRTLLAAIAADGGERALSPDARAHLETVLLPLVRSHLALWVVPAGIEVIIDGAPAELDAHRVTAVAPGPHAVMIRGADGRTAEATLEPGTGHVGPLPLELPPPEPTPTTPTARVTATVHIVDAPPPPPSRVTIVDRDARLIDERLPHLVNTRFSMWAQGTVGAWHGGTPGFAPAAGFGLTFAVMTRFAREIAVGGQLEGTWAGLLESCGPYAIDGVITRGSETCGWFHFGLRIAVELFLSDAPLSILVSAGGGFAFRARQVPPFGPLAGTGWGTGSEFVVPLDAGLRWYLADEYVFLQGDVRSSIGNFADVGFALLFGFQTP